MGQPPQRNTEPSVCSSRFGLRNERASGTRTSARQRKALRRAARPSRRSHGHWGRYASGGSRCDARRHYRLGKARRRSRWRPPRRRPSRGEDAYAARTRRVTVAGDRFWDSQQLFVARPRAAPRTHQRRDEPQRPVRPTLVEPGWNPASTTSRHADRGRPLPRASPSLNASGVRHASPFRSSASSSRPLRVRRAHRVRAPDPQDGENHQRHPGSRNGRGGRAARAAGSSGARRARTRRAHQRAGVPPAGPLGRAAGHVPAASHPERLPLALTSPVPMLLACRSHVLCDVRRTLARRLAEAAHAYDRADT
jgi:hypothetical protein